MKHLKKLSLLFAVVIMALSSLSAEERKIIVPDEEDILAKTLDTTSPYYYTNLMLKYRLGTESMTAMEYYYLYYGFLYQEEYRPFAENRPLDDMLGIMSGIDPEQPTVGQLEALIERGIEAMEVDPLGTAYEILSIDIADVDVGRNIGAQLMMDQAEADRRIAQAKAEERRAMAVAHEQEMKAAVQEMRAKVVEAEAEVPRAMASALRDGKLGVLDYYQMQNTIADTTMRDSIAKASQPAAPAGEKK